MSEQQSNNHDGSFLELGAQGLCMDTVFLLLCKGVL